jgi:uracil-DNA glycosylase
MSKSWYEKFGDCVELEELYLHTSWKGAIDMDDFSKLEKRYSDGLRKRKEMIQIYPYPDNIFKALNITPLDKVKVVFLGQDPYHNSEVNNKKIVPQATGLSFSVPRGFKIPSSLQNIYKNLTKYSHFNQKPTHGCLDFWAYQGCLMLNNSLTVLHGRPNSEKEYWEHKTEDIIKYISDKKENVVFVLWGASALKKKNLIDQKKHLVIASSHPSGFSCDRKLGVYPAFHNQDHFGKINWHLKNIGQSEIIWQIT